jgi:hypothetical protein
MVGSSRLIEALSVMAATQKGESGQAAVETALTLPMIVFLILGTLQLFMLLQAKVMAQYAVFQANRVGSTMNGRCDAMTHAALLSLTPSIRPFMGRSFAGTPGQKLGTAFRAIKDNNYSNYTGTNGVGLWTATEAIVWIIREHPRFPGDDPVAAQYEFDRLLGPGENPIRLELRMIYWAPLSIPFADWAFSRMALSNMNLQTYTAQNPLMVRQTADWRERSSRSLQTEIATEYLRRYAMKHYVFPIEVSSTMRMMSPVMFSEFATPNCAPAPNSLL